MKDQDTGVTEEQAADYIQKHYTRPDEETSLEERVKEKLAMLDIPGMEVELDPDEAEYLGLFEDDATGLEDAMDAMFPYEEPEN